MPSHCPAFVVFVGLFSSPSKVERSISEDWAAPCPVSRRIYRGICRQSSLQQAHIWILQETSFTWDPPWIWFIPQAFIIKPILHWLLYGISTMCRAHFHLLEGQFPYRDFQHDRDTAHSALCAYLKQGSTLKQGSWVSSHLEPQCWLWALSNTVGTTKHIPAFSLPWTKSIYISLFNSVLNKQLSVIDNDSMEQPSPSLPSWWQTRKQVNQAKIPSRHVSNWQVSWGMRTGAYEGWQGNENERGPEKAAGN